jgi:hypothetical protein
MPFSRGEGMDEILRTTGLHPGAAGELYFKLLGDEE